MTEQKSRLRVYDVKKENNVHIKTQVQRRNLSHKQTYKEKDFPSSAYEQWPIEASYVKAAVIEYGKRTASLNALHCAQTLDLIADKIRSMVNLTQEMIEIADLTDREALKLRQQAKEVYEK